LTKRLIACFDVVNGRVTKAQQFQDNIDVAPAADLAQRLYADQIDEIVFYDIKASAEKRKIDLDTVRRVAHHVFVPFTVGGGIRSVDDMFEGARGKTLVEQPADCRGVESSRGRNQVHRPPRGTPRRPALRPLVPSRFLRRGLEVRLTRDDLRCLLGRPARGHQRPHASQFGDVCCAVQPVARVRSAGINNPVATLPSAQGGDGYAHHLGGTLDRVHLAP